MGHVGVGGVGDGGGVGADHGPRTGAGNDGRGLIEVVLVGGAGRMIVLMGMGVRL